MDPQKLEAILSRKRPVQRRRAEAPLRSHAEQAYAEDRKLAAADPVEGRQYDGAHPHLRQVNIRPLLQGEVTDELLEGLHPGQIMALLRLQHMRYRALMGVPMDESWARVGRPWAEREVVPEPEMAHEPEPPAAATTPYTEEVADWEAHPERYVSTRTEVVDTGNVGVPVFGVIGARMWLGEEGNSLLVSCSVAQKEPLPVEGAESWLDTVRMDMGRELKRQLDEETGLIWSQAQVDERLEFRPILEMDGQATQRMKLFVSGYRRPVGQKPARELTSADIGQIVQDWQRGPGRHLEG